MLKEENQNISEEKLIKLALIFRRFKKGEISYLDMMNLISSEGIGYVNPIVKDINRIKLLKEYQAAIARGEERTYLPEDIDGFRYMLPNGSVKTLKIDRDILLLLAKYGDAESITTLENIEQFQKRHCPGYQPQKIEELIKTPAHRAK